MFIEDWVMCKWLRRIVCQIPVAFLFQRACLLSLWLKQEHLGSLIMYVCCEVCCNYTFGFFLADLFVPVFCHSLFYKLRWSLTSMKSCHTWPVRLFGKSLLSDSEPYLSLFWSEKWKSLSPVWLCDPMDYTVHGILQARILELVAFPFSRWSSQPRDGTQVSCIAGGFFTNWGIREALSNALIPCKSLKVRSLGRVETLKELSCYNANRIVYINCHWC